MKVSVSEQEVNIFELFLRDREADGETPFDPWDLAVHLDALAAAAYPDRFVEFVPPDGPWEGWSVRFNADGRDRDEHGSVRFQTYPVLEVCDERVLRRMIPPELDEVLLELNKAKVEL